VEAPKPQNPKTPKPRKNENCILAKNYAKNNIKLKKSVFCLIKIV